MLKKPKRQKKQVLVRDYLLIAKLREQRLTPVQIAEQLNCEEEAVWRFLNSPRYAHAKLFLSEARRHMSTQSEQA